MAPVLSDGSRLVTFKGGFVASVEVVQRLLAIEARGAKFVALAGGRFKVEPVEILTAEDTTFLKAHRDEARLVLAYQADDSHLFTDQSQAQPGRLPDDASQRRTA